MIVNVGGYVFGYDADNYMLFCFKNRRVRLGLEIPYRINSREQLRACCEKLVAIIENVPDEYIDLLDSEDLEESEP